MSFFGVLTITTRNVVLYNIILHYVNTYTFYCNITNYIFRVYFYRCVDKGKVLPQFNLHIKIYL